MKNDIDELWSSKRSFQSDDLRGSVVEWTWQNALTVIVNGGQTGRCQSFQNAQATLKKGRVLEHSRSTS